MIALIASCASGQSNVPPLPDLTFASNSGGRNDYLGDRWSYMESGRSGSPPVVLLHGIGGGSTAWRFQLNGLSDQFHLFAWNAPGYMLSDGLRTEKPGCREFADALADFLDAIKLMRVNLVGNSNGSRVAQCFAIYHPNRVIKLAMVGPSAGAKNMPEAQKAQILEARKVQIAGGGYSFGTRVDALTGPKTSPETIERERNAARATNPRGFLQGVNLLLAEGYSPEEFAVAAKFPVLLIAGSADRVSPIETNAALIKKAIPDARLEIFPEIGHLPHIETPERVNALLREFFSK